MVDSLHISQANRLPHSIKIGLIVIGFLLILPISSAETLKVVSNTEPCIYQSDIDKDYCKTVYELCDPSLDMGKVGFQFKTEEDKSLKSDIDDLSYDYSSKISKTNCREITIEGYKNPYKNIDNVLCYDSKCHEEYIWWNRSFVFKYPINASTTSGQVTLPVLLNDSAVVINDFPQYIWCNYTVNTTRRVIGYFYFTNETLYRCVDETETFSVPMDVDEGNETDFTNPWDANTTLVWHADNAGATLSDSSTYGNDGTKAGNPTLTDGQIGHGVDFDGDGDYYDCEDPAEFDFGAAVDFTIGSWMKVDASPTKGLGLIGKRLATAPNRGWYLYIGHTTGLLSFGFRGDSGEADVASVGFDSRDEWHHWMITADRTGLAKLYIDGVLNNTVDISGVGNIETATNVTVGRGFARSDGYKEEMEGVIDEVRIYNRTLSADEVQAIYNNTVGIHNFAPLGPIEKLEKNISLLAINRELPDFIFSDSDFIDTNIINFNTSAANTTFLILSSMNIEKLDAGGTNVITIRMILDSDEILIEEDLRSVTGTGDIGSSGNGPLIFSVASGEHNITYQFKRSGPGSINISNFDFNMIQFISGEGNSVRSQLLLVDFNHTDTSFTPAFNWTMDKTINSSTFILVRNALRKSGTGSTTATYFFQHAITGDTSPFWQRFISDSADIGSVSGIYIDPSEIGKHNHSIQSRQTDAGDVVFVNGSLVDFDLTDSENFTIPFFQASNESTNLTDSIALGVGTHLIVESIISNIVGNSYFISFFTSFSSTTGIQTPRYFMDSPNLTSEQCFTEKRRTLSDNNDIGNAFAYTICEGLSVDINYTFRLWVEVGSGESLTQLDESLLGFETVNFSITEGQVAPIASIITNPINGSNVSGSDVITWLPFFDPNEDLVTYNVTLLNPDGTHNVTIGLTNSTSLPINWNSFMPGINFLQVEGCDPGDLCSDTNISIRIIREPIPDLRPSITVCENDVLRMEVNTRTITNGNITNEIEITRIACIHGCSNWTITTLGNPGCEEGDFYLSLIFIIVLILIILIIRGAVK